ncbi:MAG: pyruvate,orthophosphate dikinase [Candidatus Aldehydirespiratoraceae bacterium]|jgi:pyruvate,orthophosphate dikinase
MESAAERDQIVQISADGAPLDPLTHGGKACGLQELMRLGLRVPPAVIVPMEPAAEIAAGVETGVVTREFSELADAVDEMTVGWKCDEGRLAVRSGAAISLPGAFQTLLDVLPVVVPEAVAAVVASTRGLRAETIVRAMGVDEVPPTAVIVQRQVDTTLDDYSGAGVATSRDPVTGADGMCGSIAWRCRGDAVMAGTIAVDPVTSIDSRCPDVAEQLRADTARLEEELGSPIEVEFAIESGELWYLQLRTFGLADAAPSGGAEATTAGTKVVGQGRPASAGVATGELHVDPDDALDAIEAGRPVVIALETSSPGHVTVMVRASGVLTVLGSPESHAAVVTRGASVPAIVAVQGLSIDEHGISLGEHIVRVGEQLTVDGTRGVVLAADS